LVFWFTFNPHQKDSCSPDHKSSHKSLYQTKTGGVRYLWDSETSSE